MGDNSDQFPFNAFETFDSDGDGATRRGLPNDALNPPIDGDGKDNADAFPTNAFEQYDWTVTASATTWTPSPTMRAIRRFDGDGVGDNADAFPNDASESVDSDGDGIGDNADAYPNNANESIDPTATASAMRSYQCPDTESGVTVDANDVLDGDNDGVLTLTINAQRWTPRPRRER